MKVSPQRKYLSCVYCGTFAFSPDTESADQPIYISDAYGDLSCPACQELLARAMLSGEELLTCRTCRGVLADNGSFADVIRRLRTAAATRDERPLPIDPSEYDRVLLCPGCGQRMDAHPYYGPGNVVVDTCAHCRLIWLDHGELAVIEAAPGAR
jgi:Zn-finger nucleic acid-binding protein